MPPLDPPPTPTTGPNRFYVRSTQDWAVQQERYRHDQALYAIGEYCVLLLMWRVLDFELDLVTRCMTCYRSTNPLDNRATAVYQQPTKNRCPDCYGTTFEGGYRALLVRPLILADTDESEKLDRRGAVHPQRLNAETPSGFRMFQGDYVFREDGSRYRVITQPRRITVRTGFDHPSEASASIGYSRVELGYEEPSTVAYDLPPATADYAPLLAQAAHFPASFDAIEQIRGPLLPPESEWGD